MNINGVPSSSSSPAAGLSQLDPNGAKGASARTDSYSSFGASLKEAILSVDRQLTGAGQEVARTVAGDSPDLHRTMAAMQTAGLSFQLGLQIRNKIIDAYNQIMQIQV